MRIRSLIFVAALLCCITGLVYAAGSGRHVVGAFTLKEYVTIYKPDGTREVRRQIYRRASDGSFRIVETDGRKIFHDRGFVNGKGFFTVDYGSRTLWRHPDQKPERRAVPVSAEPFTRDEGFVGTETLFGRTAYHVRTPNGDGGTDSEDWYLPETGFVPVKRIAYKPDGSLERAYEPYSLEFEEPEPAFVRLPDFPAADLAPRK